MAANTSAPSVRLRAAMEKTVRVRLRWWVLGIFMLALSVRGVLLTLGAPQNLEGSEPINVAKALVEDGSFRDAYGPGSGPTAHCLPLHPLLLAGIVKAFGSGPSGYLAAAFAVSAAASLAFALLPVLSLLCGFGLLPGVLAGLAGALVPANFWPQAAGKFDAALTALALVAVACLWCYRWQFRRFSLRLDVALGAAGAGAWLLNASSVPVLIAWLALGLWRFRAQLGIYLRHSLVAALVTVALVAPWALRNRAALNRTIWTRSNFGLEFQVSNNSHVGPYLESNLRVPYWRESHPFLSAVERAKVRESGEPAYNDAKLRQAVEWIRAHPVQFARLSAARIFLFWFPPMMRSWQTAALAIATALAFARLALLLFRRRAIALVFVGLFGGYSAVYLLIEAAARYRFPLEPFLLLLAASWLASDNGKYEFREYR